MRNSHWFRRAGGRFWRWLGRSLSWFALPLENQRSTKPAFWARWQISGFWIELLIGLMMLATGLSSTVFWPLTAALSVVLFIVRHSRHRSVLIVAALADAGIAAEPGVRLAEVDILDGGDLGGVQAERRELLAGEVDAELVLLDDLAEPHLLRLIDGNQNPHITAQDAKTVKAMNLP